MAERSTVPIPISLPGRDASSRVTVDLTDLPTTRVSHVTPTALATWRNPSLPQIETKQSQTSPLTSIRNRLRDDGIRHPDCPEEDWLLPPRLFDHLFHKDIIRQVINELLTARKIRFDQTRYSTKADAEASWTRIICGQGSADWPDRRRLFAILILVGRPAAIQAFLDQGYKDESLPLRGDEKILRTPTADWDDPFSLVTLFCSHQRSVNVTVLNPSKNATPEYTLDQKDFKPWATLSKEPGAPVPSGSALAAHLTSSSANVSSASGSYGKVEHVVIHPWLHGFQEMLQQLSDRRDEFALKHFTDQRTNKADFDRELGMLRRFGGQHPNIITLLATITCKVGAQRLDYHLLFPWAEGDLMHYWRSMPAPRSHMMAKWLSEQCYNIAEAIKYIHLAPGHKNDEGDDLFGRHGDVKPENVLWFKRGGKNVLVLSDLGISAIHREGSRSRQEPQHVEMTPTYQSPERDMDGFQRYISRSFDVWSLGCVFLDFIIWSLGGNSERLDFLQQRFSLWLGNVKFNLYYDVAPVKNKPGSFAFRIKECVTEKFAALHLHPACSQYTHDFLDLVQKHMLIVESKVPSVKRIRAEELLLEMKRMRDRCRDEAEYCLGPCPRETTYDTNLHPVEAELNARAKRNLNSDQLQVKMPPPFDGPMRTPRKPEGKTGEGN